MKHIPVVFILMLTISACGNKSRQTEPIIYDENPSVELSESEPDTTMTPVQEEAPKAKEKPSAPVSSSPSSSSHSSSSSSYDNMRGFDPASEDDMEDNGMSRYMENNDEEGWD